MTSAASPTGDLPEQTPGPHRLSENFAHLGLGATAIPQPAFAGMEWYEGYGARNAADGHEGRLVSMHTFGESWDTWEVHPHGSEMVICLEGRITLIQDRAANDRDPEENETNTTVVLAKGEYAINDPGVWHTADVDPGDGPTTVLFITAGAGTENKSR